jgi:hypothetical protein
MLQCYRQWQGHTILHIVVVAALEAIALSLLFSILHGLHCTNEKCDCLPFTKWPQMYLKLKHAESLQLRNELGKAASTHFVESFMWGWQYRDDCGVLDMMRVAGYESMHNDELGYWQYIIQHAPDYLQQKHGAGIANEACANVSDPCTN